MHIQASSQDAVFAPDPMAVEDLIDISFQRWIHDRKSEATSFWCELLILLFGVSMRVFAGLSPRSTNCIYTSVGS